MPSLPLNRPTHKERSQLAHRAKYGILEKHKDYVKRAQDYHSKQRRLHRLRQKAVQRNKDEFYFSMVNERTRGGVHVKDRGNTALPTDVVKLLKTQDENYVRTMRLTGLKKIDKLKKQLMEIAADIHEDIEKSLSPEEIVILREAGILPAPLKGKNHRRTNHIVFVDDQEHPRHNSTGKDAQTAIEEAQDVMRGPAMLGWKSPGPHKKQSTSLQSPLLSSSGEDQETEDEDEDTNEQESVAPSRGQSRLLKELSARLLRDRQLRYTQREFEMQRLMMGKGARKKLRGVEKVDDDDDGDDETDEDEADARWGKQRRHKGVNENTYRPRVYKWKLERKR
ncbi:hypothetical protein AMATHDRAFT_134110 [Amanita thiersii Skay4041]|uniref:U3 small nucleolar RNA-associated protein 11 n=1 Tax=Amanita thiersii Skay4041 TaxID=703135 RepID=A0A2A9P109_9AGAR|nr:hypothetical protein AMATHDRAFT_134110 [Amanita thiersii Skay4041]